MHYTIFNTPVIKTILRGVSFFFLKILGWKGSGALPAAPHYILVVAPHTSNWDLFYGIILAFALGLDPYFLAKKQLFTWPFGPLVKWLGGMPIDRSVSGNTVERVVELFQKNPRLVLAVAPEGTRSRASYWKTGFYHMAVGAGVPILLAFIDYEKKTGGPGPLIVPTGNIDEDMKIIRKFYQDVAGRYSDKTGPVSILHKNES